MKKKVTAISKDNQAKYKLLDRINHDVSDKEKEQIELGDLIDYEKENQTHFDTDASDLAKERDNLLSLKATLEKHYKELSAQLQRCDKTYQDIDNRLRHTDFKSGKIMEKSLEVENRYQRSVPSNKNRLQMSTMKPTRTEMNLRTQLVSKNSRQFNTTSKFIENSANKHRHCNSISQPPLANMNHNYQYPSQPDNYHDKPHVRFADVLRNLQRTHNKNGYE